MFRHIAICVILCVVAVSPSAIEDGGVLYYLYTPNSPNTPIEFGLPITGLTGVDFSIPIKVLCHGYIDNSTSSWIVPIKNAYMANGASNVISVDWGKYSSETYDAVYLKVPDIGDHVARMVMSLSQTYNISLTNFHLTGHSLGAHISGFAGKKIFQATNTKVGRITGLDPAGPIYDLNDANNRLSPNDASFVDAIHTDAIGFGYKQAIAQVDFWPNGGAAQNGCGTEVTCCSHCRAPLYFAESIGSNIPAWKCRSWIDFMLNLCYNNEKAIMGENCNRNSRGSFYLKTNSKSPFGIM